MADSPDDKISRGLENRNRPPLRSLAGLGDLLDFNKLDAYARSAGQRAQRLAEHHEGLRSAFAKFEAEEIPKREQELRGLPLSAGQRLEQLRRLKLAERRRLLEISGLAEDRARILGELREQRESAVAIRDLWSNPISVLVRQYANTEAAAKWREASKTWGANQTRDMIDAARASFDHALLCVCFEKLDSLSPEDRKHVARSKADVVAEMPVAKMAARAVIACDAIALVHDRADMHRREVAGEPIAANEKIDIGQRAIDLAPFFADPESEQQE